MSSSTPSRPAIGRVTKSLVAVTMATRSPSRWWRCTRPSAAGCSIGRMTSSMKRAVARARSSAGRLAPGRGGEVDVGVDVQPAGQVVLVERVVAAAEVVAVGPAQRDDEFAEGVVGVAGQQRAVEVEQRQVHRACAAGRSRSAATSAPSSSSICRSSGTVTGRALASAKAVEPVEQPHQVRQVALEARQQVVHDLVGQEDAALVGLAAQHGTRLGLGQRLQREDMAPGQARAQVVAQRQVHRRQAAGGHQLHAVRRGLDEQREGGVLGVGVEPLAAVDAPPAPRRAAAPTAGGPRRRTRPPPAPAAWHCAASARSRCVLPLPAGPHR